MVFFRPTAKKYPGETHYGFVSGNPIIYADADGRDKIYTLTIIDKDGKSHIQKWTKKDIFVYKRVSVPGFGNDKFYKQDLIVSTTIDLRAGKATYSQALGGQTEIPAASYGWQKVIETYGKEGPRGSQAGGITFTSAFSSQADGPKTDVTKGSDGSVNIDALSAAFGALSKSGEALKFTMEDLPEWINQGKDMMEAYESSSTPTNSSSNTKLEPVEKSTEPRDGPGWTEYIRNKDGTFKQSARQSGMPDSNVKGKNGAPDTVYKRPYKTPPVPKKNIKGN